jgi:probable F420-dependent oxidoreductase
LRLGTAIANVFTRGPAALAQTAAGIAELAPGRFCLGVGTGSAGVVEDWNGGRFERPYARLRDTLAILRAVFRGERVNVQLPTLSVEGFRLSRPPAAPIPIFVAALRERMLRLAGESADGVIINWLAASDVPKSVAVVREAAQRAGRDPDAVEIACRIFVLVDPPGPAADLYARRQIAGYLNVSVYRAFQSWLGHGDELAAMHRAWDAGDRRDAVAAIPEPVVRGLFLSGTPEERRAQIRAYIDPASPSPSSTSSPPKPRRNAKPTRCSAACTSAGRSGEEFADCYIKRTRIQLVSGQVSPEKSPA